MVHETSVAFVFHRKNATEVARTNLSALWDAADEVAGGESHSRFVETQKCRHGQGSHLVAVERARHAGGRRLVHPLISNRPGFTAYNAGALPDRGHFNVCRRGARLGPCLSATR